MVFGDAGCMKSLLPLIFLFSIWSMVVFSQPAMAVTGNEYIWTEEPQYLKGDTYYICGIGFTPYTPVLIKVTRPDASVVTGDGTETPGSDTVVTNVDGNFAYSYMIDGIQAEGTYTVEAIDTSPDPDYLLAATSFIDTAQFLLQGCSWHKGDCTQEAPPAWADGMTPMDGWTSGVLKGWFELEDVPYRLRVNLPKPGDAGTYYITNEHDNLRSGGQGADDVTEFYIGKYSDGTLIKTCNFQPTRGGGIRSGHCTGRPILHWDPAVSPGLRFMQIPHPRGLRMYRSKTYSPRRQSVVMVLLKGVSNVMTGIISPVMDAAQPVSSNSVAMESSRPD